jgi:hypothetical protein
VNLATCILDATGAPARERNLPCTDCSCLTFGAPGDLCVRAHCRGRLAERRATERSWFVTDDEEHRQHLTAGELPHHDFDELAEWLWWSICSWRFGAYRERALAHRLAFLQATAQP